MKKLLMIVTVFILALSLAGCDLVENPDDTSNEVNCIAGYKEENGKCVKIEDNNTNDDTLDDEALKGPEYVYSGNSILYEDRDIASNDCEHLDNISEWQPVWCDEFNYEGLPDSTKWSYDVGGHGWGNQELQYYTNADIDNAYVGNGYLTIKAIKEGFGGNEYTSARLISKNSGDWLYGKIQIRAQMPSGKGTWPAAWLLPTNWEYGDWPDSGEIDIMEYVGYDPNTLHSTIHTKAYNHGIGTQVGESTTVENAEATFNVYEMEWEPNIIRYYLNGYNFYTVNYNPDSSNTMRSHEAWPFDKEFHLLLNLAIGGGWGGAMGVDDNITPAYYLIDYVRVYQKDYAGMDNENPHQVKNLRVEKQNNNYTFVAWDTALDDVMVEYYEFYINDVFKKNSTHNGIYLTDVVIGDTVKVIPVDFAGNKGIASEIEITEPLPPNVLQRIEAEDYITTSNTEVESTSDTGGGQNVGYIVEGSTLTYEITVLEAGTYKLTARAASLNGNGGFDFYQGNTKLTSLYIGQTGGWQNWQDFTSNQFTLTPGTYTFKILSTAKDWNINYFEFEKIN